MRIASVRPMIGTRRLRRWLAPVTVLLGVTLVAGAAAPPASAGAMAVPRLAAPAYLPTVDTVDPRGALDMTTGLLVDPSTFGADAAPAEPSGIAPAVSAAVAAGSTVDVIIRLRDQADLAAVGQQAAQAASAAAAAERGSLRAAGVAPAQVEQRVADAAQAARARTVVDGLRQATAATQPGVQQLLTSQERSGHAGSVKPYWIFNGFAATVDNQALDALAAHPDVASVTLDAEIQVEEPVGPEPGEPLLPGWSLETVNAPDVWGEYGDRGAGVVVGIMDTGTDGGHPALADSWRGRTGDSTKSWYVPTGEEYPTPGDGHGHGTHVMGSIVGGAPGQLTGVAPEAQWISAKIFRDSGSTNDSIIHDGFQWMLAPGGDPAAAPDLVNNSWGGPPGDRTFWDDVLAWEAAGIVPIFANGNAGPGPGTAGAPGSFPHAIAVGATNQQDTIVDFSSRGPVVWDGLTYTKPDVSAPGHLILSTWPRALDEDGYNTISGTSMAAPHVTGVVALMLSANPDLTVAQVREILSDTVRVQAHMGTLPNNSYGAGIVDAYAAVTSAAHSGTVTGAITAPGGPVAATVQVAGATTTSDAGTGAYELLVPQGRHELTVTAYGFLLHRATVTVDVNATTTYDAALAAAPVRRLTGTVTGPDGPVQRARVTLPGTPVPATTTDADGRFGLDVAEGSYSVRVIAAGHRPTDQKTTVDGDRDIAVKLAALDQPTDAGWAQYQNNANRAGLSPDPLAVATLQPAWTADAGSDVVFANPVIADGRVFLGSDAGRLVARDVRTGEQLWAFQAGPGLRGAPAVAGGLVFTGGGTDGGISALDAATGEQRWHVSTPGRVTVYTTPSVVDGVVYAVTGPTSDRSDTVFALDAATGEQRWAVDVGADVFAGPAVGEGLVVVGNAGDGELTALDATTGAVRWTYGRTVDYFIGGPSLANGTVYIATTDGRFGGSLLAVDAANGMLRWENRTHGDGQGGTPAVYGDLVIAGSHGLGFVAAYDRHTGDAIWYYRPDNALVSVAPLVSDDGYVFAGSQIDHRFWALDASTGEVVFETAAADNVTTSPAYADGRLVVADADGNVYAFQPTGTLRGTITGPDGPVAATVTVVETGTRTETDPQTGRFSLPHEPGRFTVTVSRYGLGSHTTPVEIVAGETSTVDARLDVVGDGAVRGVVRDESGSGLAGASVTLAGTPLDPATTDAAGEFTLPVVAAGTYEAEITRAGYVSQTRIVEVVAGETASFEVTLDRYDLAVVGDYQGRITAELTALGYVVQETTYAEITDRAGDVAAVIANGASGSDPGGPAFRAFLDATDAAGTSVVFLDQWSLGYGAINHLLNHVGDPQALPSDLNTDGRLFVAATLEHPLTAGLTVGEPTELLVPRSAWSAFTGYSGTTVARLQTDEAGDVGGAIAYQPRGSESIHVLLGSLAASASWGIPEVDWQPVARTILGNAVAYAIDAEFGTVTGTVTDEAGAPLAGVRVSDPSSGQQVTTATDGTYRLLLPSGEHILRFDRVGTIPVQFRVEVVVGDTSTVDITLTTSGLGAVRGVVTSARDGSPVAGAAVTVEGTSFGTTAAADGSYLLGDVPEGFFDVRITADGYQSRTITVDVDAGVETVLDVELDPAPRVGLMGDYEFDSVIAMLAQHEITAQPMTWTDVGRLSEFDVVIFNNPTDPGEQVFREFIAAMDAASVSGIFPDDRSAGRGGVRLLREYLGDPTGFVPVESEGVISYVARDPDHPIFAGLDAQSEILLPDRDAAEIVGYSGTPLADLSTQDGGLRGVAAAYSPRATGSVHLLLSGLAGHSLQSPGRDWAPDGMTLYVNSIRWAAAPGIGGATGRVIGADASPLPARVELVGTSRSVPTDGDGEYDIGLDAGTHTLRFTSFGYAPVERTVTVDRNGVVRVDVELQPGDVGVVTGLVTSQSEVESSRSLRSEPSGTAAGPAAAVPVAGATVTLRDTPVSTTTDETGRYRLELVEPGSYELEVVADGHVRARVPVTVTGAADSEVDVVLRPSPTVGVLDDYEGRLAAYLTYWGYTPETIGWADTGAISSLDLVIVNLANNAGVDPGAAGFAAFMDALNRAGTPALWMDQFGRGSFRYLRQYAGDPQVEGEGRNDGVVTAHASVPDHPLLAGLPESFEVTAAGNEYSWYNGFSGTTVATVTSEDPNTGGGLVGVGARGTRAVDVLLGTLTVSLYGYPAVGDEPGLNWSPEAERLLRNALPYALDTDGLGGEVRGTLRSADGTPLGGTVTVVETGDTVATRPADGSYVLPLPAGTWTLRGSMFGYVDAVVTVEIGAGVVAVAPIDLAARPTGTLTGIVTGPGGPIAGASVAVLGAPRAATTGSDGSFTIADLPVDTWTVRLDATGHQAATRSVTVVADATVRLDVVMVASHRVAIVGDSANSLTGFLGAEGYVVEQFTSAQMTTLLPRVTQFDLIIFNGAVTTAQRPVFAQLIAATGAAGVSTIYGGQFSGAAIGALSIVRGDPASAIWDFDPDEIAFVVAAPHPIFAGIPVGEPVVVLSNPGSNQQWLTYSGYSGITLANARAQVGGADLGNAVGYKFTSPSSVEILLGSLAASTNGRPGLRWTPAAERIYLNAVAWAIDARQAELAGMVTGEGGSPVAGATVTAVEAGASTTTAANGSYTLALAGGTYTIRVQAFGHVTAERTVTVPDSGTATLDVNLTPLPRGSVAGVVRSSAGPAIAGAVVTGSGVQQWSVVTDSSGAFAVDGLPEGTYAVTVTADRHLSTTASVTVVAGAVAALEVTLERYDVGVLGDVDGALVTVLRAEGYAAVELPWSADLDLTGLETVVVNGGTPDEATYDAVVAAADAAQASLVYTGTWGVDRGGLRLLERYTGRVTVAAQGYGEGTVVLSGLSPGHPLFAGLDDPAELIVAGGYYSALGEYVGRPLAEISVSQADGSVVRGVGAGFDWRTAGSVEVVLSASAVTDAVGPGLGWTTAGQRLLLNTVEWSRDVVMPAPGVPSVTANPVTLDATVIVAGTADWPSVVSIRVDGEPVAEASTSPDGRWTAAVPLAVGSHTITAVAANPAGSSAASAPVSVSRWDPQWTAPGNGRSRPVQIRLDGYTGSAPPADAAVLVVRNVLGDPLGRYELAWTDEEFYLYVLRDLPAGRYTLQVELTIDGTVLVDDGSHIVLR